MRGRSAWSIIGQVGLIILLADIVFHSVKLLWRVTVWFVKATWWVLERIWTVLANNQRTHA